jgi:hypothetical protein
MRRIAEDPPEAQPPRKIQRTLANFFKKSDGSALDLPLVVVDERPTRACPDCSLIIRATAERALSGALLVHRRFAHPEELYAMEARISSAAQFLRQGIFDFEPMEPIAELVEEAVAPQDAQPEPAHVLDKAKKLRHSYTLKQKYRLLQQYAQTDETLRTRLRPEDFLCAVSVLEMVSKLSGIPPSTIQDWLNAKEKIVAEYTTNKRSRKKKHLGASGRKALFPVAEANVKKKVKEMREKGKLVSKAFVLKTLKVYSLVFISLIPGPR